MIGQKWESKMNSPVYFRMKSFIYSLISASDGAEIRVDSGQNLSSMNINEAKELRDWLSNIIDFYEKK